MDNMETLNVELTVQDVTNILVLINAATVKGSDTETIVELKAKLSKALPEVKGEDK